MRRSSGGSDHTRVRPGAPPTRPHSRRPDASLTAGFRASGAGSQMERGGVHRANGSSCPTQDPPLLPMRKFSSFPALHSAMVTASLGLEDIPSSSASAPVTVIARSCFQTRSLNAALARMGCRYRYRAHFRRCRSRPVRSLSTCASERRRRPGASPGFVVEGGAADPLAGDPILCNGESVGHVTSGGTGFRLGERLALGHAMREHFELDRGFDFEIFGERRRAVPSTILFHNRENVRLRGMASG